MATTDPDEPTTAPTTPLPDAQAVPDTATAPEASTAPPAASPAPAPTVLASQPAVARTAPAHPTWYRPFSWAAFGLGAATVAVLVALLGGGVAIGFAVSHHETRTSEVSPFGRNGSGSEQGGSGTGNGYGFGNGGTGNGSGTGNGQHRFRQGTGGTGQDGTGTQNAPGGTSTPGASNG